ncbi:MAG: hypothetical protein KDE09_13980 [Anaerolineales bacterium]|nr:hypothetical protein [Anaerolineales bacterium]
MLSKRQTFRLIFSLGLLGLIGLTWILPTQAAQGPTAITLDYFEGFWDGEIVELEWGTGTELNTQGFEIMRVESSTQPANKDDGFELIVVEVEGELYGPGFISLVPPMGTGITGGDYLAFDADVDPETTYWYIIVEHENSGAVNYHDAPGDMVRVDTMAGTPTPTPSGLGGGSGNSTATPTLTPQPSNTPQPTATQSTGGGSGPTATPESTRQGVATATSAAPQPTSSGGDGGFTGASAQPTATLANSSLPGGSTGDSGAIAQITATSAPGDYPAPDGGPSEGTDNTETYPDGLPTATPYPISEINGQGNGTDNGAVEGETVPGNGFPGTFNNTTGNNVSSNDFLNGTDAQQGETQSRERLLLWIGFIAAMLVFAGGMFGSIILFTRQRA